MSSIIKTKTQSPLTNLCRNAPSPPTGSGGPPPPQGTSPLPESGDLISRSLQLPSAAESDRSPRISALKRIVSQDSDMDDQEEPQVQSPAAPGDNMIAWVSALEGALLPCLPARELQAINRSLHPAHQIDVERHVREFMEAAKKLQMYFIGLQREDPPTKAEILKKEIAAMEEELKEKNGMIEKQEKVIQVWMKDLKDQLDKHNTELERV